MAAFNIWITNKNNVIYSAGFFSVEVVSNNNFFAWVLFCRFDFMLSSSSHYNKNHINCSAGVIEIYVTPNLKT